MKDTIQPSDSVEATALAIAYDLVNMWSPPAEKIPSHLAVINRARVVRAVLRTLLKGEAELPEFVDVPGAVKE